MTADDHQRDEAVTTAPSDATGIDGRQRPDRSAPDRSSSDASSSDGSAADETDDLSDLIEHVHRTRGFDLSGYKPATLRRRIDKRVQALGLDSHLAYLDHLQVHPDEFPLLFDAVLINVTDFRRDLEAWELFETRLLPELLAEKGPDEPIRIWSAGCSSGQEAYTLAMILHGQLGDEPFRRRVKIYGTDVDEDALSQARQAMYSLEELSSLPQELRERFFQPIDGDGDRRGDGPRRGDGASLRQFRGDLRRNVIFGRHDLVQDAPISRLDVLLCRNTLMYFNADVQRHILERLHFGLRAGGLLFLGKAEKLLSNGSLFEPLDPQRRFFTKVPGERRPGLDTPPRTDRSPSTVEHLATNVNLRDAALEVGASARLGIDPEGRLVLANATARSWFAIEARDLGRPLRDLEVSYRPAELRGAIDRGRATGEPTVLRGLEWHAPSGETWFLDVDVLPLGDGQIGTVVTFTDATERHRLTDRLRETQRELEGAHLDIQTSNEELETMNEELQSTVEELETTNEELQSTNEELETMNAELQATNDELNQANQALVQRGDEVDEVNGFLAAILRSLRRAVVVLDPQLLVRVWNERAVDLWGLTADEVTGQHLMNLDVGFPVVELREPLLRCVDGSADHEELVLRARNRRGMAIDCKVVVSPLVGEDELLGAILLMSEQRDAVEPGATD
jgi:two-component system, chemotaxis family, CheB/CheR fusion protein